MAEQPGRCRQCGRRYADSLFSVNECVKQNMTGIRHGANKRHEDLAGAIERYRAGYAAWLVERGYENCTQAGCKKAIKPLPPDDEAAHAGEADA